MTEERKVYTADEVALRCSLASYILNYWALHFPALKGPDGGVRVEFSEQDVALVWRIKQLLYTDHLTIEQARRRLEQEKSFPLQYGPTNVPKPGAGLSSPFVRNDESYGRQPSGPVADGSSVVGVQAEAAAAGDAGVSSGEEDDKADGLSAEVRRLNTELAAALQEASLWKRRYTDLSEILARMSSGLKEVAAGLKARDS